MDELQKLCDNVPEFANEKAYETFEKEFGFKITDIFDEISAKPIAAASIG
jgi:aarF domain-containing kinase